MKDNNSLIIALSSYAGMGPYAATIINSFYATDNVWFVLGENYNKYFYNNIKQELHEKCTFIPRNDNKRNKILNLYFSDWKIIRQINKVIKNNNIKNIHLLTNETSIRGAIKSWIKTCKVTITIHDLHPHEANKSWYKEFRMKIIYKQLDNMIKQIPYLVTNSHPQLAEMKLIFSDKKLFFHSFPTLVTDSIINGKIKPIELCKGNTNLPYILFFGRIEKYKGIHLLYESFLSQPQLYNNYRLVIAGSGDIYFRRNKNEKNVIFINRYIKDEEIAELYTKASCTVYPYVSATQSGVLSLSCYFQTPTLVSNVPFFQFAEKAKIAISFNNDNIDSLTKQLILLLQTDNNEMKNNQLIYYMNNYKTEIIRKNLLEIYNNM